MTAPKPNYTYQVGASLPVDAPSYVRRFADTAFLQKLKEGRFCYVLNSRQMGKSSLRVRTMQQLQADGIVCAAIDLTGIGKHKVTLEQWYGGIVYALVESCQLEDTFDWQEWWQQHQTLLSPVQCLSQFIEKILLVEIQQPIVIFVDEIDRVLSQDFSLDDFFALIRYFQNQRVDNPKFERLTFALLGVATPSDLMSDKTQTPFNIGEGIELHGFQTGEVAPLIEGLKGKVSHPQAVMQEILDWTGGQPFLTQKLCQLVVEESELSDSVSVEQVVHSRIVENWESQDDPEHLRTIRDRILRDEQRSGYLLELYRQILSTGELVADNSTEQSELKLSGLVVQRQGKLRVYNRIYQAVFDLNWIERQLKSLRPYSEAFQAWIASGSSDESRLLRGKALQDAQEWSQDKSLTYQDKQFLAASKEKEIEEKVKRRIRIGFAVLLSTLIGAVLSGIVVGRELVRARLEAKNLSGLSELSGELHQAGLSDEADEARRQIGLSYGIENPRLKQALLLSGMTYAYQKLEKWQDAEGAIQDSIKELEAGRGIGTPERKEVRVHVLNTQGGLFKEQDQYQKALEAYSQAFDLWKSHRNQLNPFNPNIQILTANTVESIHRDLIDLLAQQPDEGLLLSEVRDSLKGHYFDQLDSILSGDNENKWRDADVLTWRLMLFIARREREGFLDVRSMENFPCDDLRAVNEPWIVNSEGRFGFSVQRQILESVGWQPGDESVETWIQFYEKIEWGPGHYNTHLFEDDAPDGNFPYSVANPLPRFLEEEQAGTTTVLLRIWNCLKL